MSDILFTLNAVAPVFLTILIGTVLGLTGVVNEDFTKRASTVVFYVAIPAAIVTKMEGTDLRDPTYLSAALLFCGLTVVMFLLAALVSTRAAAPGSRGAFIQGSYRGNLVIVGLPVLLRALGPDSFPKALVVIALAMPLYNLLAVVALTVGDRGMSWGRLSRRVVANPLIVAVALGIVVALTGLRLPEVVSRTGSYLGEMAFPLALLMVGASMSRSALRARWRPAVLATIVKCAATPLAIGLAATWLGFPAGVVAVLAILAATPTAVISYVMARAMDADHELAGAIVFATIVASVFSMSAAIYVLRTAGAI